MAIKIICCKSEVCGTAQVDLVKLKQELKRPSLEFLEIPNLCSSLKEVNTFAGDLILLGCQDKVIMGRLNEKEQRIVFAPIREECTWIYQNEEKLYKEILLQIKLALHRLKFKKQTKCLPLNAFNEKIGQYIQTINGLGPNPFKF